MKQTPITTKMPLRQLNFFSPKKLPFGLAVLVILLALNLGACKQGAETAGVPEQSSSKIKASVSAQPLPGGKARFTVAVGNLDASSTSFVRIANMTFSSTTGTVAATVYEWISDQKKGITAINSHRCTFDGVTATCDVYSPTGWIAGGSSNPYKSWSGTYTYSGSTLSITWTSGKTGSESWTISNPTSALARARLASSSTAMGYTHGRGYGSNAPWGTYKTISQMQPFPTYTSTNSRRAMAAVNSGVFTLAPATYSFNTWASTNTDLSTFTTPSSPIPINAAHKWDTGSTACNPDKCNANPRPGATGIIYHIASANNSRAIAYTNFCACLPTATEFPCYPRNLHPSGLMQIIDDNSNLVALVGIEAQNPVSGTSGYPNYQFHLWDFNNIP